MTDTTAALNIDEVRDAVDQVKVHCRNLIENTDYTAVSVRGILYTLGYNEDQADVVLSYLFDRGFTYCLDPKFHKGQEAHISSGVCHFGPDQLLSRLW